MGRRGRGGEGGGGESEIAQKIRHMIFELFLNGIVSTFEWLDW